MPLYVVPPAEPTENLIAISLPQRELVAALEHYLDLARAGKIISLAGVFLDDLECEMLVALHGAFHVDAFSHIGALEALKTHLSTLAMDGFEFGPPQKSA